MQSTGGDMVDYNDDEAWRNLGRYNQLYKLWLIGCTMESWLEGALEVIQEVYKLILSDSIRCNIIMFVNNKVRELRSYCLYNTPIGVILNGIKIGEKLHLDIGGITFYFERHPDVNEICTITYYRKKNRAVDICDKYDWMIYDYLLMLSEKQLFTLDIGLIANRAIYDDITKPNLISVIVDS
jgi:hypothetical protein